MDIDRALGDFDNMSKHETIELCRKVSEILVKEPPLLKISSEKTLIVGDLHGDLESCVNALQLVENQDDVRIVFLGDYVDRGPYQTGVMNLLLWEKKSKPDMVFLLRGNHETLQMNLSYGFLDTLTRRFKEDYEEIYEEYLKVFSQMPLAGLVNNSTILVHGGLARGIRKPEDLCVSGKGRFEPEDPLVFETLWNDPSEDVEEFSPSPRGMGIHCFGKTVLERFLRENGLKRMVRSHEPEARGYRVLFNGMLITVFSCRFYGVSPVAMELKHGEYDFKSLM